MPRGDLIQIRRGTTTQWNAADAASGGDPTRLLAAGELGKDTTTGVLKVGDGTSTFAALKGYLDVEDSAAAYAARWTPSTAYATDQVVQAPDGSLIYRIAGATSRASFDATEEALWAAVSSKAGTIEQTAQSASIDSAIEDAQLAADTVVSATVAAAETYAINPALGSYFSLTITGNCTLADGLDMTIGQAVTIELIQNPAGGHTITLPTDWIDVNGDIVLHDDPNTADLLVVWRSPIGLLVRQMTAAASIEVPYDPIADETWLAKWDAKTLNPLLADLAAVSSWLDPDSGLALAQATTAKQPVFHRDAGTPAKSYIRNPDTRSMVVDLSPDLAQSFTIVVVARIDAIVNGQQLVSGGPTTQTYIYTTASKWRQYAGTGSVDHSGTPSTSAWAVIVAYYNGASSHLGVNGTNTATSVGTNGLPQVRIFSNQNGAGNPAVGDINFVAVKAGALTDEAATVAALAARLV